MTDRLTAGRLWILSEQATGISWPSVTANNRSSRVRR